MTGREKQSEKDRMVAFKEALDTSRRLEAERRQREIEANNVGGSLNPMVITSDEDEELFRLQQEAAERGEPSPFNRLGKILRCGVHNGDGSVKLVTFGLGFVVGGVEVALILILVK